MGKIKKTNQRRNRNQSPTGKGAILALHGFHFDRFHFRSALLQFPSIIPFLKKEMKRLEKFYPIISAGKRRKGRIATRTSNFLCRSGSSSSCIRFFSSRRFSSRLSWAASWRWAWVLFKNSSCTDWRFFSALIFAWKKTTVVWQRRWKKPQKFHKTAVKVQHSYQRLNVLRVKDDNDALYRQDTRTAAEEDGVFP